MQSLRYSQATPGPVIPKLVPDAVQLDTIAYGLCFAYHGDANCLVPYDTDVLM